MKHKARTILKRRTKRLGSRTKTGHKVPSYPPKGSSTPIQRGPVSTLPELSKVTLAPLRVAIPKGLKDDLEDIVRRLGLYANVSELARAVLLKERDRRIGELRRVKKVEARVSDAQA